MKKNDIQIRELLRHLEQYIYPLELNRKQKYSTYCMHVANAFRSIFTCFYKLISGMIVNFHNT